MFNILNHKGDANQNNIEIPSHPSHSSYYQESKQQQMLVSMAEDKNP
jgi:hypothetical protein